MMNNTCITAKVRVTKNGVCGYRARTSCWTSETFEAVPGGLLCRTKPT